MNKGQVFSLDMVIAFLLFTGILLSSLSLGDYTMIERREQRNQLELASLYVLSALVEAQGNPQNWTLNASGAKSAGLARNASQGLAFSGPWVLDEKLSSINESNINETRDLLGLAGFNFNITINRYNGSGYAYYHSFGTGRLGEEIGQWRRYALLDGTWAEIVLRVSPIE